MTIFMNLSFLFIPLSPEKGPGGIVVVNIEHASTQVATVLDTLIGAH